MVVDMEAMPEGVACEGTKVNYTNEVEGKRRPFYVPIVESLHFDCIGI